MRILAVVSGAPAGRTPVRPADRARRFVDQLVALGPVDLVVVHDARSPLAERLDRRSDLEPDAGVSRCLEVAAPPPRPAGLLRDVHLRRSAQSRASTQSPAALVIDAFVAGAPQAYDVAWCGDIAALARATSAQPTVPAVVDVDGAVDLSGTRARRAARSWAAKAYLVTVPDTAGRDRLAVPGTLVVADGSGPAMFASALSQVVDDDRAYRPARTP